MLAVAGLAELPADPASAASSVVSYWGSSHYEDSGGSYQCGTSWQWRQGVNKIDDIYNPCSGRVWVHYVSVGTGQVQAYCVNPDGRLAYAIPLQWNSTVTYSDIQLSANTSACASGQTFAIAWENADSQIRTQSYTCLALTLTITGEFVEEASNLGCVSRMWLHESASGGGASYCINPGQAIYESPADVYWQVKKRTTSPRAALAARRIPTEPVLARRRPRSGGAMLA